MGANNCNFIYRKPKSEEEDRKDFYQTIPHMSFALLDVLKENFSPETRVLDCCAGNHSISNVLKTYFHTVDEIDLFYSNNPIDFLTYFPLDMKEEVYEDIDHFCRYFTKKELEKTKENPEKYFKFYEGEKYPLIVANSPFTSKWKFIEHALDIGGTFATLFPGLSLNYNITGDYKKRKEYCGSIPMYPKVILSEELSEDGSFVQSGTQNYNWFLFDNTWHEHQSKFRFPVEIVKDLHDYDKKVADFLDKK